MDDELIDLNVRYMKEPEPALPEAAGGAIHYCLFLAAAGGAERTSAHGSDFLFFCVRNPFHHRLVGAINVSVVFLF